jgi:hypothetical protein
MALLNFPTNPYVGQQYQLGQVVWIWNGTAWIKSSNQNFGQVTATQIVITTATNATGTNTGALIVNGGVSIAGNLYVTGSIIGPGATSLSTSTNNINSGTTGSIVYQIQPGQTGFIGIGSTGSLLVSNGTTATFSNTVTHLTISDTTNANTYTNGALVVKGGVGIGGDLWVNGTFYAAGHAVLTTATFGAVVVAGQDIDVTFATGTNYLIIDNVSTLETVTSRGPSTPYQVFFNNTTNSTSTTTGGVVIAGGLGIGEDVFVEGRVNAESVRIVDAIFDSTKTIVNTSATTVIDTYSLSDFRAAKYLIQIDEGSGGSANFESTEIMLLVDNNGNVFLTQYATLSSISLGNGQFGTLGEFSANSTVIGGDLKVYLYFTAKEATNKTVAVLRTSMVM